MANQKISQLTELVTADADDVLAIVDTSATATKKITKANLVKRDDVTRSIYITKAQLEANAATTVTRGSGSTIYGAWACADAAVQGVFATVELPLDAKPSSSIHLRVEWTASLTEAGTSVQWQAHLIPRVTGDSMAASGTIVEQTGSSAAKADDQLVREASFEIHASASAGDTLRLSVRRLGPNALDTYTGIARIVGLRLEYTAAQP